MIEDPAGLTEVDSGVTVRGMSEPETLKFVYEDLVRERDRLRDAGRAITSKLGLLSMASAVVVTLFGALSNDIHGGRSTLLFEFALAAFVAMVLVGTIAVFPPRPYRKLRKEALQKLPDGGRGLDQEPTVEWLSSMIDLERKLTSRLETTLGEERGALLLVQGLFVAQIVLLGWITLRSA